MIAEKAATKPRRQMIARNVASSEKQHVKSGPKNAKCKPISSLLASTVSIGLQSIDKRQRTICSRFVRS